MWGIGPRLGGVFLGGPLSVIAGGEGTLDLDRNTRLGATAALAMGKQHFGVEVLARAEHVWPMGRWGLTAGGGLGLGEHWYREDAHGRRRVVTLPLRLDVGVSARRGPRQWQMRLYTQYDPVMRQAVNGLTSTRQIPGPKVLLAAGIEMSVLFGDFTPPRKPKGMEDGPLPVDDPRP